MCSKPRSNGRMITVELHGLEVPLGKRAALRFEGRGYLTFTDTDTAFFCSSNNGEGVCRIVATGSSIFQGEALAGILVRF